MWLCFGYFLVINEFGKKGEEEKEGEEKEV